MLHENSGLDFFDRAPRQIHHCSRNCTPVITKIQDISRSRCFFFRDIYLKITRSSNGVTSMMDRMIGWMYPNTVHQNRGIVAGSTCQGVLG
jgi:hypothetical protein